MKARIHGDVSVDGRFDSVVRTQILAEGQGLIAETFPRKFASNMEQVAGRTVNSTAIPLLAGDPLALLALICPLGGNNVSEARVALLDQTGAKLAETDDFASRLGNPVPGNGLIDDIVLEWVPAESGLYYLAFRQVGDAYLATALVTAPDAAAAPIGDGKRAWGEMADQDTIPDLVTVGPSTTGPVWFGVA